MNNNSQNNSQNKKNNKNIKNNLAEAKTSIVIPSVFLLSLTTIIYYFYSKRS